MIRRSAAVSVLLAITTSALHGQAADTPLATALAQLDQATSLSVVERMDAFAEWAEALGRTDLPTLADRLSAHVEETPSDRPEQERVLATLLIAEAETESPPLSEAYSIYLGELVSVVAILGSPYSVEALADYVHLGDAVTDGLALLGNAAIDPLVRRVEHPDPAHRIGVARALWKLTSPDASIPLPTRSQFRARSALVYMLDDPEASVRLAVIESLEHIVDRQLANKMDEIVQGDPYMNDEGAYPVREAAAAWLLQLLSRG